MIPNYRAWDKERKEMCIVDRLTFMFESIDGIMAEVIDDVNKPGIDEFRRMIMPENLVLMQSTGLTDRNGTEIYEGDVVKEWAYTWRQNDLGHKIKDKETIKTGQVVYCNDEKRWAIKFRASWGFHPSTTHLRFIPLIGWEACNFKFKIIGNFHQHPELLEGTP